MGVLIYFVIFTSNHVYSVAWNHSFIDIIKLPNTLLLLRRMTFYFYYLIWNLARHGIFFIFLGFNLYPQFDN